MNLGVEERRYRLIDQAMSRYDRKSGKLFRYHPHTVVPQACGTTVPGVGSAVVMNLQHLWKQRILHQLAQPINCCWHGG